MSFFSSRRSSVHGLNGGVATSQPIASQVGIDVLKAGGNAVDAAVTMASTLGVVEPMSTGIGGDIFALIWDPKTEKISSFNGSGTSSRNSNPNELLDKGFSSIPTEGKGGAYSVSVPGSVDGWEQILKKFGTISLSESLQPGIKLAEEGYPVSELISWAWAENESKLKFRESGSELLNKNNKAPVEGEVIRLPELASSMYKISKEGPKVIYDGSISKKISDFIQSEGGWLDQEDLKNYKSFWTDPIKTNYRGYDVYECPPNGQGLAALIALNIVENLDFSSIDHGSSDFYHYLIESIRIGFADSLWYITDPAKSDIPTEKLLSKEYAKQRFNEINKESVMKKVSHNTFETSGDTVYITAIDKNGMGCSLINSTFQGFGSGLVVPETGIALQNRGALFSLDKNHPNYLEPNMRPFHTIIPCMVTKDSKLFLSFGVMGGFQQPQGHLQVLSNIIDYGFGAQKSLDALRFSLDVDDMKTISLEEDLSESTVNELKNKGHHIELVGGNDRMKFGGAQLAKYDHESGVISLGTEPRKDGSALAY
ncbi:MAG: gamma-glutamyltransferase [Dehalococcoidia bacterium]